MLIEYCKSQDITLSEGLERIGSAAFENCSSLVTINFPASLTYLSALSFASIGPIEEIYLPNNLIIHGAALSSNNSFKRYLLSETNENYQVIDGVLYSYDLTKLISYPSGITTPTYETNFLTQSISEGAFEGNNFIEEVTYGGVITTIDQYAFAFCQSLKRVTIPSGVSSLFYTVFYQSNNITEFIVEEGNSRFESVDGVIFSKDLSILYFYPGNKLGSNYNIPETTTTIADIAFFMNQNIESILISKNIELIRGGAFSSMYKLTEINVDPENNTFTSLDGVLYSKDLSILYTVPTGMEIITYDIPETVTTIYYGAFESNPFLEYIIIPENVTKLYSYAFQDCINLKWIVIPNSIDLLYRKILLNALDATIYFSGSKSDYNFIMDWNLDNLPSYFLGEWEFDENYVPKIIINKN